MSEREQIETRFSHVNIFIVPLITLLLFCVCFAREQRVRCDLAHFHVNSAAGAIKKLGIALASYSIIHAHTHTHVHLFFVRCFFTAIYLSADY
jgi:hypothetical protein